MAVSPEIQVAVALRRARVVALREGGATWAEVAAATGLPSPQAAIVDHRRATAAAGRTLPVPPACGTWGAYKAHLKRGEPLDDACAEACRRQAAARYQPRVARPG